jgi:hypothetical protein
VWKPQTKLWHALRVLKIPYAFAVGEPATYVQAPKAKGRRSRASFGFPTPRSRVLGQFAGAHRKRFSLNPVEEPSMFPSFHAASGLDSLSSSLCWSAIFVYSCGGILSAYFSNLMNIAALMRVLVVRAASATTAKCFIENSSR